MSSQRARKSNPGIFNYPSAMHLSPHLDQTEEEGEDKEYAHFAVANLHICPMAARKTPNRHTVQTGKLGHSQKEEAMDSSVTADEHRESCGAGKAVSSGDFNYKASQIFCFFFFVSLIWCPSRATTFPIV